MQPELEGENKKIKIQTSSILFQEVCPVAKKLPAMKEPQETQCVWSLGQDDPLEEGMAAHSSILAWRIPWTEEPGRFQSMGFQRVRHNWSDLVWMHAYFLKALNKVIDSLKWHSDGS